MATVSWADASEPRRGRSGRIPYSLYRPLLVDNDQPWKVIPRDLVPTNKGDKDKFVGYWNMQKRFRTRKGKKIFLPPKLHFYYLGTGPYPDAKFRERIADANIVWVAMNGAKTAPTGYGVRKRNAEPQTPKFNQELPEGVTIVEDVDSRGPSRSQSRNRSSSRPQSRNASNERLPKSNSKQSNQDDIMAAVAAALEKLGFERPNDASQPQKKQNKGTPKPSRAQSPAPSRSKSPGRLQNAEPKEKKKELEKPRWKRQPNDELPSSVMYCFGPRDLDHNFGSDATIQKGVKAPNYPQFAELVPSTAALLFDSHIDTKELGDSVLITYTHKVKVPKEHPNLGKFLNEVNAFTKPSQVLLTQQHPIVPTLNPVAPEFNPTSSQPKPEPIYEVPTEIDIVDEVN
uniref:Nucleoprotein n=1 Tax=229E-related bat coronavirus TaxID=1739614 RepID=A0A1L2KGE7_CVH22|nr:N protein [229E-related bat coronavirus]